MMFFLSAVPWPSALRTCLLRLFGAKVGRGVYWKPRVNIHIPWKLEVGDHALFGEEVFILNFETVVVGEQACISQRAFICTGNHDFTDIRMRYRNRPIRIGAGAWIGAQVFVAPGVDVGREAVATAGSVVLRDLPAATVCSGNPCTPVKPRWKTPT
jgi:putative colanic acid biosynthesis acetyltransferase WcaF